MEIISMKKDKATLVVVKGKMDAITAPEFDKRMDKWISGGENYFIIDFNDLSYISSAGLRSILAAAKRLKKTNGKVLIASIKDSVKNVFEISGFISIFDVSETVEDALQRV